MGYKPEALTNVVESRLQTKFRGSCGSAILQQNAVVAQKVGILERCHNALIGVDTCKKERGTA